MTGMDVEPNDAADEADDNDQAFVDTGSYNVT